MKVLSIVFTVIAAGLIIFNLMQIDYSNPFGDSSVIALITIFTALCAIVLLQILRLSKRVEKQLKTKNNV